MVLFYCLLSPQLLMARLVFGDDVLGKHAYINPCVRKMRQHLDYFSALNMHLCGPQIHKMAEEARASGNPIVLKGRKNVTAFFYHIVRTFCTLICFMHHRSMK